MPHHINAFHKGLTSESYVDAYNEVTEHWETRCLSSVRKLPSPSPRPYPSTLLYKLRAHGSGLLDGGMKDFQCKGVGKEIDRIQQCLLDKRYPERVFLADVNAKKKVVAREREREREGKRRREQEDLVYEDRERKRYAYGPPPSQERGPTRLSTYMPRGARILPPSSPPSRLGPLTTSRITKTSALLTPSTNSNVSPASSPPPDNNHAIIEIPHHTHPPLLRFPNDYHVCTLSARFDTLDRMLSESVKTNGGITQKIAFEVRSISI